MDYEETMRLLVESDGNLLAFRLKWRSPKMGVTWSSCYTKFTGFRTPYSGASWYPKDEDEQANDWYVGKFRKELLYYVM